jgi:hypothetical protein
LRSPPDGVHFLKRLSRSTPPSLSILSTRATLRLVTLRELFG